MQQHEALLSTARAELPVSLPPPPPLPQPPRRAVQVTALTGALVLGMIVGIAIGHATAEAPAPAPAAAPTAAELGHLGVSSKPTDGNVTVDGRFVGVTPVERLDLDPGKHTVVIDAFGYQPYAGTLAIEPHGKLNLKVTLAPLGTGGTTSGDVSGAGKATIVIVPPSALQPTTAPAADTRPEPRKSRRSVDPSSSYSPSPSPPPPEPPPRPRRDCGGEKSRCRDGCSHAEFNCRSDCPNCVTCPSSVGSEECRRQCDSCRASCDRNTQFCQSSCDSQYDNCQASNNY